MTEPTQLERDVEMCELKARLLELEKRHEAVLLAVTPARPSGPFPTRRGWIPRPWSPALSGIMFGIFSSLGTTITAPGELTFRVLVGAGLTGISIGLAGYFGIKSMGPRPPAVP